MEFIRSKKQQVMVDYMMSTFETKEAFISRVKALLNSKEIHALISTGEISAGDCRSFGKYLVDKYCFFQPIPTFDQELPFWIRAAILEERVDEEMVMVLSAVLQRRRRPMDFEEFIWRALVANPHNAARFYRATVAKLAICCIAFFFVAKYAVALCPFSSRLTIFWVLPSVTLWIAGHSVPLLLLAVDSVAKKQESYLACTFSKPPSWWLGLELVSATLFQLPFYAFSGIMSWTQKSLGMLQLLLWTDSRSLFLEDLRYIAHTKIIGRCYRQRKLLMLIRCVLVAFYQEIEDGIFAQRLSALCLSVKLEKTISLDKDKTEAQKELIQLYDAWLGIREAHIAFDRFEPQAGYYEPQGGAEEPELEPEPEIDPDLLNFATFWGNRPSNYKKVPTMKLLKNTLKKIARDNPSLLKEKEELANFIHKRPSHKSDGSYKCGMCRKTHKNSGSTRDECPFVSLPLPLMEVILPFLSRDTRVHYEKAVQLYGNIEKIKASKATRED